MQRSYCQDLYHHNEDALPIWVLLEIISFGDLIKLYRVYFDLYHKQRTSPFDYRLLEHIRNIRNAAAHNNCLIAHINRKVEENNRLANILTTYPEITKSRRKKYLRKQFTQDFTALILAYAVVVQSDGMRTSAKKEASSECVGKIPSPQAASYSHGKRTSISEQRSMIISSMLSILRKPYAI